MTFTKYLPYSILGSALSFCGIGIADHPVKFLIIFLITILIEINAELRAHSDSSAP